MTTYFSFGPVIKTFYGNSRPSEPYAVSAKLGWCMSAVFGADKDTKV